MEFLRSKLTAVEDFNPKILLDLNFEICTHFRAIITIYILTPGGPGGPRKPGTPIDPSRPGSPFSPGRPGRPSRPS